MILPSNVPQIAHETEVKAQIKLRFSTSTGQPVVVVRCFQVGERPRGGERLPGAWEQRDVSPRVGEDAML